MPRPAHTLTRIIHDRGAGAVYVALVALLSVSAWAALRHPGFRVVDLFAANLAAETLGLIVTMLLVHRYLERQERALRLRGSLGAVRRCGRALATMADTWAELVKGSLARAPEPAPTALRDLLAPDLSAALVLLDARDDAVQEAARRLGEARDSLRAIIATYGSTLDPVYLGAIDDLVDDPFLALMSDADAIRTASPERFRSGMHGARAGRIAHFERLLLAIDCHDELARDAARLRDPRTAPRGDGYSAAVPLDVDLRVHAHVAPEWWCVAPRPGTLRSVRNRDAGIPQADGRAAPRSGADRSMSLSRNDMSAASPAVRHFPVAMPVPGN